MGPDVTSLEKTWEACRLGPGSHIRADALLIHLSTRTSPCQPQQLGGDVPGPNPSHRSSLLDWHIVLFKQTDSLPSFANG